MPILAIILGFGMIVGAVAIVRLSNIVENTNVSELPITVQLKSTSLTPGGDLPDYAPGPMVPGQTYDTVVSYTTTKAVDSAAIIVEFAKTGINATDVLMSWTDVSVWHSIVWTDNGDVLHGTLGFVGSQPAGAIANYYATLSYAVTGTFNFKVWVEGSMAT